MLKIKIIHVDNLQTPVDEQPAQASNRYLSLHR